MARLAEEFINNIKKNTDIPVAVGFGIKSPKDAAIIANTGCDGIVVGSALVEIIENSLRKKKFKHNIAQKVGNMVKRLRTKLP